MKKITALAAILAIFTSTLAFYRPAHATNHDITGGSNGPNCGDGGYFTPDKITINSGDTITFHVPANDPYLAGIEVHNFPGGSFVVSPGGSHTTPPLVIDVPNYYATWPSSGCQKGTGSVTVLSPTTPSPSAAPPAAPTTSPPPPPPAPVAAVKVNPPASLKLDKAMINSDKIDTSKSVSVDVSQPLTISGNTIPNGLINLTIHSIVRNEITRADANGFWSFTITNLEPGNHIVDATVTDPATSLTSESATLLKFKVTGSMPKTATANVTSLGTPKPKSNKNLALLIIPGIILLAGVAGAAWWFMKKRKKDKNPQPQPPKPQITQTPPDAVIAPTSESTVEQVTKQTHTQ